MSCIRLVLTDPAQTLGGDVHGSIGDAAIAALSAEPETIHELELALARFAKRSGDWSPFASLYPGENFEPYDAGIVVVDLAARVIVLDSTYSAPQPISQTSRTGSDEQLDLDAEQDVLLWSGEADDGDNHLSESPHDQDASVTYAIGYHDGEKLTDVRLPYRIPDDWLFVGSIPEYEGIRQKRRAERAAREWLGGREVLFGKPLSQFVASEILIAPNLEAEDLFAEIHAKWLLSPRADLQSKSPRELLLAKQEYIDFDLHSRELQWSFTGECPPPLLPTSHAYRFAGFGTHEIVIYYDLIRLLLSECHKECYRLTPEEKQISLADETERLEHIKSTWLETPAGDWQGKAPALIIEWERKRIPLAMSGKAAMVDEDCPVCQAMAEDLEMPVFWHLDGCNLDNRFEFSFFKTRAEWEADRRRWEEFNRAFDRKWKERERKIPDEEATFPG